MDLSPWAPVLSPGGTVGVAFIALGGVIWTNRRADTRERDKHWRDRLGRGHELIDLACTGYDASQIDWDSATGDGLRTVCEFDPYLGD